MKQKEMIGGASALTWDAVLNVIRADDDGGVTNHELAERLNCDYQRVSALTRVMYEAGALSKRHVGRSAMATTLFYLPV